MVRVARKAIVVVVFLLAPLLGTLGGVLFAYGTDLPEISRLEDYRPNVITRLLAMDGSVIEQFATERNRQIDDGCGSLTNVRRIVAAARKEGLLDDDGEDE